MSASSTNTALPSARQQVYRRKSHVIGTIADDSTVLLDFERGVYYTLNEVGGRVWSLLQDGTTFTAIVDQLRTEYEAPTSVLETDTAELLDTLLTAKLIDRDPAR